MIKMDYAEHYGKSVVDYEPNIGRKVCKTTCKKHGDPKPFRSGNKVNTVKGVIMHPTMNIPAYTFVEDDSYVECRRCNLIDKKEKTTFTLGLDITLAQDTAGNNRYTKDQVIHIYDEGLAKIITEEGRKYLALVVDQMQRIAEVNNITELLPTETPSVVPAEREPKKEVSYGDIEILTEEVKTFVINKGFDIMDSFEFLTRVEKVLYEEIDKHYEEDAL